MKYLLSCFLSLGVVIFMSNNCVSQYSLESKEAKEFEQLQINLDGLYQIQLIDTRMELIMSYEMLKEIDKTIKEKKRGEFYYLPYVRIVFSSEKSKEFSENKVIHTDN